MRTLFVLLALAGCRNDAKDGVDTASLSEEPAQTDTDPVVEPTDTSPPVDTGPLDEDGDGLPVAEDCDDADAEVGGPSTWFLDADGDGYGHDDYTTESCDEPSGYAAEGGDCDDGDDAVHPYAAEDCAVDIDANCDGSVGYADEDGDGWPACEDCDDTDATLHPETVWYTDADADGWGDEEVLHCERPSTAVDTDGDCDDEDPAVHPDADETCNGLDDDCDELVDDDDPDLTGADTWYVDEDGDGYGHDDYGVASCEGPEGYAAQGGDCDDGDAASLPGGSETCDGEDDDCDGLVDEDATDPETWYADADGDGFGDAANTTEACDAPSGHTDDATDCDDGDAGIHPDADEVCNDVDDDCDGLIDDDDDPVADPSTFYVDGDGDGYGLDDYTVQSCEPPSGYATTGGDCDDGRADVSPVGTETCDDEDEDCDGVVDEDATDPDTWYADADGDGYGDADSTATGCGQPSGYVTDASDCDDTDTEVSPETVWHADADGDGFGDGETTTAACEQPSGYVADEEDCDDGDAEVHPDADEVCNDADDDCDGLVDDDDPDLGDADTFYVDADGDGYGLDAYTLESCEQPSGYATVGGDCDDGRTDAHPAGTETCDGEDEDCDGAIDEDASDLDSWYADADGDGFGDADSSSASCDQPSGYVDDATDCDDADAEVNTSADELCDGIDNDCDGLVDDEDDDLDDATTTFYEDADGDGYGDVDSTAELCEATSGWTDDTSDCDDSDAAVGPCGSCLEILALDASSADGVYSLDPCGSGSLAEYWCDMSRDGGGWTVAGWQLADATTTLGVSDWGTVGDSEFSSDLACISFDEVMVFNEDLDDWYSQSYSEETWAYTASNFSVGSEPDAFKHGTYGPSSSLIMMGCVDYQYYSNSGTYDTYACDVDWSGGVKGHLADYAGEFCSGGRLDYTWAWSDGSTCSSRGTSYTWGYAIR